MGGDSVIVTVCFLHGSCLVCDPTPGPRLELEIVKKSTPDRGPGE